MPCYDYRCKDCDFEFETIHSMTERPVVTCSRCGSSDTSKVPSLVGIVVKNSRVRHRVEDRGKLNRDISAELREDFGVEKVHPLSPQTTLQDIYHDVKMQSSVVKEQMRAEKEKSEATTKAKQREWTRAALKRTPRRYYEREAKKAEAEKKKRAIQL